MQGWQVGHSGGMRTGNPQMLEPGRHNGVRYQSRRDRDFSKRELDSDFPNRCGTDIDLGLIELIAQMSWQSFRSSQSP